VIIWSWPQYYPADIAWPKTKIFLDWINKLILITFERHLHCLFGYLIKSVTGSDNFVHLKKTTKNGNWFALPYSQPDVLFSWVLQRCNQSCNADWQMDDSSYRRNFDLDNKNKTITITGKSIFKLVKLQSLVVNCCKMRKI
jgi:hypothetical protein